jgi:tRNA dimethylallyltransferase
MRYVQKDEALQPLVAIVGPTAAGKTETGIHLAQDLDGIIISADSRQVYRMMDIGTAKPTVDELASVPHELIDILNPDQELSLAEFQEMAYNAIKRTIAAGKLPFLVGGTGQYVKAVIEGWGIPEVPPQPLLRSDLLAYADTYGSTTLHAWLSVIDPEAAIAIDYRNLRRVVRALEVYLITGSPISELQQRNPPAYRVLTIGLTRPREMLYERADERIEAMIASGFVDEVRTLLSKGYTWRHPSMSSLGYPDIGAYLRGEISLKEATTRIKQVTRRFIRHQYNWFRLDDAKIRWFDLSVDSYETIRDEVSSWLYRTNPKVTSQ